MKISNIFPLAAPFLLLVAGCTSYPERTSSYPQSAYSYTTPSSTGEVYPSPNYSTSTTPSPVPAYSTDVSESDRTLIDTVQQALNSNPTVSPAAGQVYVSARNGAVTLNGTVPNEQDRQYIDNVVRNISGVYSLHDQLQVVVQQPTGTVDTRLYPATPLVANGDSAGNIFNLHVQGLNEPDRSLAQHILQELRGDSILPSLLPVVNVTVQGGRVILEGNVQSTEQRRTIESAVARAAGVNNVEDRLRVSYPPGYR